MRGDRSVIDKILNLLRPYSANWSGTLGRGDLVIPQRDIARLIQEILEAAGNAGDRDSDLEVGDGEIFQVMKEAQRLPSVQDQVHRLRAAFRILKK